MEGVDKKQTKPVADRSLSPKSKLERQAIAEMEEKEAREAVYAERESRRVNYAKMEAESNIFDTPKFAARIQPIKGDNQTVSAATKAVVDKMRKLHGF